VSEEAIVKEKECSWCGNIDEFDWANFNSIRNTRIAVQCKACGICGPWGESREEAVKKWNDREKVFDHG